ncbi:MAG: 2-succinylbenzoate--CoA ligase [Desulfovibrio sp.]
METLHFATSGSTGVPKTYAYPPDVLEEEVEAFVPYFADRKRVVSVMPTRHIFGYVMGTLLPKGLGVPAFLMPPLPVAEFFNALSPGDLLVAFPVFWQAVLERFAMRGVRVPDLMGVTASAPCPVELIEKLTRPAPDGEIPYCAAFAEIYGSTETSAIGIRLSPHEPYTLLPIWDKISLTDGSAGITRVRKSGDREPPIPLPDDVLWYGENLLVPVKRKDNAVQVGGVNVYPQRVAAVILEHPAVKECVVRLMRPDEGVRLKAFIVPAETARERGKEIFNNEFRAWLRERLETAAIPKSITLGDSLPVTATGKSRDWDTEE